ncbi:MAG TPA: hypothetical protein VI583_06020, partial [Cyclobacteriaceae bacterium]|nr:hypothetical protein [Cyclobacteriaceae bacterium]
MPMVLACMSINAVQAQTRGMIIDPATTNVMDPDGDGFVSISPTGFSDDGYYVDEFEFKMFGLPIHANGEVLNDIQSGALCGTTDLSVDTTGYAVYGVIDDFGNLIFRFRLAGDRPSVEAYTVLLDTDGKMGAEDPNSTANNPGFEIDITLIKNNSQGVFVYNLDGIESCPSPTLSYSFAANFQKSVADIESCGDEDYFLDFFVPFADLETAFGITTSTEIRMIAVTNVSATCAMSGSISDVGGVDDEEFGGCIPCAFDSLSVAQCPTSFSNLCQTCEGFKVGFTPKPKIRVPVKAETKVILGTSAPTSTVFVDIYNSNSVLIDRDTVTADSYGNWVSYMDTILFYADSITARAQLSGKCRSGFSESDLAYAIVEFNIPTSLSGPADTLVYYENAGNAPIEPDILISDPDDSVLVEAVIKIVGNYLASEDSLVFTDGNNITGSLDQGTGTMTLVGFSSLLNYQNA